MWRHMRLAIPCLTIQATRRSKTSRAKKQIPTLGFDHGLCNQPPLDMNAGFLCARYMKCPECASQRATDVQAGQHNEVRAVPLWQGITGTFLKLSGSIGRAGRAQKLQRATVAGIHASHECRLPLCTLHEVSRVRIAESNRCTSWPA